ncbi:osteopontin [Phycodurus eques]|uniref:osteopontin n=1 Tax=Phycodurus eques TaxID=693459 RepID=UPI002ACDF09A|nr:osteopontin [Phycodurus eques]
MKVVFVFVLLFAAVLCRPARKFSDSSAESSEEAVRRPAASLFRKQVAQLTRFRAAPFRLFQRFLAPIVVGSDESTDSSDEPAAVETPSLVNFETEDDAATDTPSVDNQDETSEDSDDDDDDDEDDDESEESESEEEDEEDSSESGESSTVAPETVTPVIVFETTEEPLLPTIVTDTDSGRGDSMGGYPSEYKSYVYPEEKTYHKAPSPYKSYEYVETGKKLGYDMPINNEVEKSPEVYKSETYQEHSDLMEEDTSTPENQDVLPEEEEENAGRSDSGSSADVEEEEEDYAPEQSSEEATATPGAADSDSDESDSMESDSDERGMDAETTTDIPVVITAK